MGDVVVSVNQWDVSTGQGFMTCYRSTVRDLYGYAGLLAGTDRAVAEDIVRDTYMSLLARAQRGDVSVVGYGYLRRSVRHRWIDSWRAEGREQPRMAAADTAPATPKEALDDVPVRLLAELPVRARTVMVLRYVEDMPVTAIAEALGTTDRAVESVMSRALHRMRRESLTTGRWIREHFGPEVRPRPDFARELGAEIAEAWPAEPTATRAAPPSNEFDVWAGTRPSLAPVPASSPTAVPEPGGRRGTWLVAAAVVLAVGAGAVYVATRSDGTATTTPATVPDPSSLPVDSSASGASTVPGDSAAPSSPPTTGVALNDPVFEPACVPKDGGSAGGPLLPAGAEGSFGPLQPQPVLTIHLPALKDVLQGPGVPYVSSKVTADGVVLTLISSGDTETDGGMTAMVGFDGTVKWVSCTIDGTSTGSSPDVFEPIPAVDWWADEQAAAIQVGYEGNVLDGIVATDAAGNVAWRREDLVLADAADFVVGTAGGLKIVQVCTVTLGDVEGSFSCSADQVFALDSSTGATVYERSGTIGFVAGGHILLQTDGIWRILDATSGDLVQEFGDDVDFETECCAGSEYHWLRLYGGVVLHNDYDTLRVWLPASSGLLPQEISLP